MPRASHQSSKPVPAQEIELSILIPVRNEGLNLKIMLKILRATVDCPHEVVVVYDDPQDTSGVVVHALQRDYPNLHYLRNALGIGVINALRAGVAAAKGKYVLIFAADEIGPVLAIDDMLSLMKEGCEFVNCT